MTHLSTRTNSLSTVRLTPYGPILNGHRASMDNTDSSHLYVPILSPRQRLVLALLTVCWAAAFLAFWMWWLQPEHNIGLLGLVLNSVLLFYLSFLPSYFLIAVNRLRRIDPSLPVPRVRTAFVVTKAPSEPWEVARRTLVAMQNQDFPHNYDIWLCDEAPTDEVLAWCEAHGVLVSTRHGIAEYHQPVWPRRTRCKEGNLAYFYDNWGYRDYDVVAQLDCDHVPARTYLAEVVRPFVDPDVGYVAAPSMCDTNARTSWSARGRSHKEGTFHGPFQAGHIGGLAPVCIGSHYAVRTSALQTIAGVGPELAEDFSTAFLFNSAGWRGGFALNAEAHGEGPYSFAAMTTQEYQWSRSLMVLLMNTLPHHLARLPWQLRLRFAYALSYYPILVLTMVMGLGLCATAAITGTPWVNVSYGEFLLRGASVSLWLIVMAVLARHWGLLRPQDTPVISWENWLYTMARWPFIAWGVISAVVEQIRPRQVTFRVTPKSGGTLEQFPTKLVLPYVAVSAVMSTAALIGESVFGALGYVFLCLLASTMYALAAVTVPVLHAKEAALSARQPFPAAIRETVALPLTVSMVACIPLALAIAGFPWEHLGSILIPDFVVQR